MKKKGDPMISLATIFEMNMQSELHKFKADYPNLFRVNTINKPVGKVMLISTVDEEEDNNLFKNIWKIKLI